MDNGLRIFIDGACAVHKGGHMGIGVVIEWQASAPTIVSEYGGQGTNNIAEYKALHRALELARENQIKKFRMQSDSQLVVCQVKKMLSWINADPNIKGFKCNDMELQKLRDLAVSRIKNLRDNGFEIQLEYISREFNLADNPAKDGCTKNET